MEKKQEPKINGVRVDQIPPSQLLNYFLEKDGQDYMLAKIELFRRLNDNWILMDEARVCSQWHQTSNIKSD